MPQRNARPMPPAEGGMAGLIELMATLRGPGGCPWDAAQTHESLVRYLIEECHELVDAIESGSRADLIEELGDVLYQVLFHADIAAHTPGEEFDLDDVADRMIAKMVGRHPHVFGDRDAADAAAVTGFWEELKRAEKPERTSVLDGIPRMMPSLLLADKLVGRAGRVGVHVTGPAGPPHRPAGQASPSQAPAGRAPARPQSVHPGSAAQRSADPAAAGPEPADEAALGDLLLRVVADARLRGLDAERALRSRLRRLGAQIEGAEARLRERTDGMEE